MIRRATNRAAEWEIRYVFDEVAKICEKDFPLVLLGGTFTEVDGLREYTGLRV